MIVSFILVLMSIIVDVMAKLSLQIDLPNWFYENLEMMIFYAYKLNGIFPVEALFKIIALFLLIKSGVMIARVVVWFVNVFRGSGAESPI